jgi:xanthine dehydrogenase accessory factor
MRDILASLDDLDRNNDYIVAIIIKTRGSTYRKSGAIMLVSQRLSYQGLLSGGCLENDIVLHCEKQFIEKSDTLIVYNMRDQADMLWGMGLGCDGEVTILLKYLAANDNHLDFLDYLVELKAGTSFDLTIGKSPHYQFDYSNAMSNNNLSECTLNTKNQTDSTFISFAAPLKLLICGAPPDAIPVTSIAHQIGWNVEVIDHRLEYAQQQYFPLANQVNLVKRSQWKDFSLNFFDAAIIMSHQYQRDHAYLEKILNSEIPYIGLLGPIKRRDRLLRECNTDFAAHQGRLFAPIGLEIGADSPQTIALAIVTEIQAFTSGRFLRDCKADTNGRFDDEQ